jgi:hypothetical protein
MKSKFTDIEENINIELLDKNYTQEVIDEWLVYIDN